MLSQTERNAVMLQSFGKERSLKFAPPIVSSRAALWCAAEHFGSYAAPTKRAPRFHLCGIHLDLTLTQCARQSKGQQFKLGNELQACYGLP